MFHPIAASQSNGNPQVYFDCNATTPTLPQAAEAAFNAMRWAFGNPSSTHMAGLQAKNILETTRRLAAKSIQAETPSNIVFTSGATEGIQIAVFSAFQDSLRQFRLAGTLARPKILYGSTEHKAVPQALEHWAKVLGLPFDILAIPVDKSGLLDLEFVKIHLPQTALLCTMAVNNETGIIAPLDELNLLVSTQAAQLGKCLWLVDCVQALGKIPLDLSKSAISYAAFSGHKLYAPKGIGFLYVKKEAPCAPLIVGGGQERGLRSGTENLPGVAALGQILSLMLEGGTEAGIAAGNSVFANEATLKFYRDKLANALKTSFPNVVFNAPFASAVATTLNFAVPGFSSPELLDLFDAVGMRVSSGSACSSGKAKSSYVLDAMGLPEWQSANALRLSFGPATSSDEIDRGCHAIAEAAAALRSSCVLPREFGIAPEVADGLLHFKFESANTWLYVNKKSHSCVVIDPLPEISERLLQFLQCQKLKVLAVLDTHSHADHLSCRPAIAELLRSEGLLADGNTPNELGFWHNTKVQLPNGPLVPALLLSADDQVFLAQIPTPGHTSDSVCYVVVDQSIHSTQAARQDTTPDTRPDTRPDTKPDTKPENLRFAFCGDTVLSGGLGRTNFDSSSPLALLTSLQLFNSCFAPHTVLCPAHDYDSSFATTWQTEKDRNPLLQHAVDPVMGSRYDFFVSEKAKLDSGLAALEVQFQGIVCGIVNQSCSSETPVSIQSDDFKERVKIYKEHLWIIDVREPFEVTAFKSLATLGVAAPVRNVPLSRFVNLIAELLQSPEGKKRPLLFICRSGTRSLFAAQSIRRLGFENAWSIEGGMAYGCDALAPRCIQPQNASGNDLDFVI